MPYNKTIGATNVTFNVLETMKNKEAIDLLNEIFKLQNAIVKKANTELLADVDFSTKIALKDIIYICGITQDKAINAIYKLTIEDETL